MHPVITIFCPFTRRWAIDRWLENLDGVEHDPALTNICAIIDMDELYIRNQLRKFTEEHGYRSFHVKMNDDHHPVEASIRVRRHRIAEVHEQAKDLVAKCDGEIVIGLEDDTQFDRLPNFDRLITPFKEQWRYMDMPVGMVQGVQMGRWGSRMLGAWLADDSNDPKHIETLLPSDEYKGYEQITGGGWYGYATTKHLFLAAPYFDSSSHPWGPDVEFGFWLKQQGYYCVVDWQTLFGHDDHGTVMYPDDPKAGLTKIVYNKNSDTGKWERQDHEQTRR